MWERVVKSDGGRVDTGLRGRRGRLWGLALMVLALAVGACASDRGQRRTPTESASASRVFVGSPATPPGAAESVGGASTQRPEAVTIKPVQDEAEGRQRLREPVGYQAAPRKTSPLQPALKDADIRQGAMEERVAIELAFDAADLYQVLDATLYQLYHVNYIVDPSIQAKVTFHLKGNYNRAEFISVLNDVLQMSGLALVPGPGQMVKVVRKDQSGGLSRTVGRGDELGDRSGDVTRMIRLHFLDAGTAAANIRPFLSPGAVVVSEPASNAVVITDTLANIDKVAALLSAMDVDYIREVSWKIFPLEHAKAEMVADDVGKILGSQGLYARTGAEAGSFQVFPIKSLNAVMVASRVPSLLDHVQRWIPLMDRSGAGGQGIYVYFVENGSAEELAYLVGQVYGIATTRPRAKTEAGLRGVVSPTTMGMSSTTTGGLSGMTTSRKSPQAQTTPTPEAIEGKLTSDVSIVADPTTNTVIIRATPRDYEEIIHVIRQLDITPRQVLISVIIAEISLSGSLEYGIEWLLQGHWDKYTGQAVLDGTRPRKLTTGLGEASGFVGAVFDSSEFLRGLIYALGKDSKVNILSSPNIMASDHKEAYIEVAEEVPLVTGETTSQETTATTRSIQYRKTGIILKVTPHINSRGLVKLDISQEVSERGEKDEQLKTTSIISRKAETSLVVNDGQMIVIGGLMRNRDASGAYGIPGLRNMPVLKYLFGGESKQNAKSELIILITPKVVRSREEADTVTGDFYDKVKKLRDLVEQTHPQSNP